ncbi:hypothetical protein PAMP_004930 [Pampus punctatissimus]
MAPHQIPDQCASVITPKSSQISAGEPEVILTFTLDFPGPFHIVLRYATPQHKGRARVRAKVLVVDEAGFQSCCDSCAIAVTGLSLSSLQSEVRVTVHVDPKDGRQHLFRVVLRFTNPSSKSVNGSIKTTNNRGTAGSEQSKEVVFPKSPSPSFLTVPGEGFAEPFALTPGKWIIHIRAEGVLLDYLVLLPRDYYEAPLLQEKITQPCTYLPTANRNTNCLLYKHVAMERFSSALGSQGILSSRRGRRRRQTHVRRPTPDHPEMAALNGRQSQLQLSLRVPRPGLYALVLEYANELDSVQNVNILISGQLGGQIPARANIYNCAYSFLCRSVAVDNSNQVALLELTHKTELLLQTSTTSFLLYKVYAVPAEEYSIEYVQPKVLCVSTHGRFTDDSRHCVLRQFDKPTSARILYAARDGQLSSAPAVALQQVENEDWRRRRQSGTFPVREPQSDAILLKFPQTRISFTPEVPLPGRYVVVVHYHQPEHISFPVEVQVDAGHEWKGSINASFCPSVSGCREVVIADRRIALDFDHQSWRLPSISLIVPPRKTLILDYIMLVPDSSYTPDLLKEKPLDKSSDFIQQCRGEGFYIDPRTSSQFCRDSARSLVAAYNDGALPCNCDKSGSRGTTCDPVGGQCPCRQHVIGQQCTKCATGYYGFPYCRQCECGRRLCDDVTGRCICPPQTVKPACDVCQNETFSYHPLLGCEGCECSPYGIKENAGPDCDRVSGQCSCKPRIAGRQCDRCAAGYYRFPDCVPCDCNQGGVTPNMCHSDTGRCLCKRNVGGVRCDICREGSFYFDPSNPHGCTSCFCFGATDQCQSSSMHRGKFVEMHGWHLESPDQEEVPSVLNTASNTVVADIQELPATVQDLYWVAPPSYLGDSVSSYGGFLTYQSKSFGIPSEGMTLMDRRPDVLLTGQEMTLIHMAPQVQFPDKVYQGRVQLVEGNWRHAGTNRPVSREDMMMVLARLVDLRIRALYFTQTQRLSIGEVGMEEATNTGTGGPGNTVENCSCPTEYTGDSCEKCAPGYYRDGSGPYLGRCVPCDCNGLADECEEKTGRCLNCQYNTAGDHCDRCKEGYYGNAAQRTCRVCPCPFSAPTNSFAIGCRQVYGDFQCICKAGYNGDRCERCAPGFYGDPLIPGGSCRPCNCNGNDNNCDPKTGVCKNTLEPGDTNTDENCQECDNCAQTLLKDLEKLDDEMGKIKAQLENATASASSQDRLKKLEKAVSDTKILVNKFSSSINTQKSRVNQLEDDVNTVRNDITSLKDKADKSSTDADKAVADIETTHKRAKDLDSAIQNMLRKIQALLDQLKEAGTSGSGDRLTNENQAKMLEDAQRMVKEMENRNFTPQKTAAEKERDEAKKLLDYIKANVSKQCDQNEAAAEKIRDLLRGYNNKLKDLDEALKQAADLVKKANAQNGLNAQALGDLQNRISDLKKERKTVEDQMAMAENELQKTEDLVKMLIDSKTEYEHLAAQLDGAKTDLNKKVTEIVKAAMKEPIVVKAEDHAKTLTNLAKDLEDAVKNASGLTEVRNAKDAIDAYKNITDAINAAEKAANEAKEAADNALNNVKNQKLTQRAKDLKDTGNDLLENAQDAEKNLQDTVDDLTAIKERLKNADKKKKALEKDLLDAQKQLNDTKRDDIGNMIDEAKRKAASANDTASSTMDKLNTIRKEIDKISVTPVDSNLSSVLDDVDQSVKNLLTTIPSLNDKISEVENLTSQFTPLSNISENIKKIKELIENARDAANRIMIPMKFTGDGHVEMRPPKDLEDLKAYTAMSLSLQRNRGRGDGRRRRRQTRDTGNMFVLYLGNRNSSNYIGMFLRNNVLYGVYKLNGVEYEIATESITMSASEPATFDKVDLHRMYQDAEIILTKEITSSPHGKEIKKNNQGQQNKNLLDLSPSDIVFYVGGYPANFTPPNSLNYPNYKGCIEFSSFNDKVVSLYNFHKAEKINLETPCRRFNITMQPFKGCMKNFKLHGDFKTIDESVGISKGCDTDSLITRKAEFSLGSSLSAKPPVFSLAEDYTVSLGFKSTENQGLILQRKQLDNGMNLALENGYAILSYKNKMWKSNKQYHDGRWHYLTVTNRAGRIDLLIDDEDKGQEQSGSTTIVDGDMSLGEDVMLLGKDTFKGCISNLYTRRQSSLFKAEDLSTYQASGDILLDVCTADSPVQLMLDRISKKDGVTQTINESVSSCSLPVLVKHSYRLGGPVSSLSYSLPLQVLQPKPHFSLDVKTRSPEGLLFFAATRGGRSHLALYMSKGRIRFSVGKQREIFNREKYNDGKWHSVIFSLEKRKFRLVVDGIRAQDGQLTNAEFVSMQQFMSPVYLGSAPESLHKELKTKVLPKQSMSGCVRNFKMNGAPMSNPTTNQGAGPCFDGMTQPGAYFSGNGAHVIINDSFVVGSSFELLFNIRPRTQTGLLLHVGGSSRTPYGPVMGHYLSIYMLQGKVVAHVNNGKGEFTVSVQPKSTLCDGMFHKISVIKRKNVVQLYVDTMDNYKIGPPSFSTTLTKDPLYVGGIPETLMQQTLPVMSSFVGCIQDMKINSDSVSFNRLSGVFGPVNLKECPG